MYFYQRASNGSDYLSNSKPISHNLGAISQEHQNSSNRGLQFHVTKLRQQANPSKENLTKTRLPITQP